MAVNADPAIPFSPSSQRFQEYFYSAYASQLVRWLGGQSDTTFLAVSSNSPWEAALTGEYVLAMIGLEHAEGLTPSDQDATALLVKLSNCVDWAATCARPPKFTVSEDSSGQVPLACWEDVLWDTAVVSRFLVRALHSDVLDIPQERRDEILDVVRNAVQWQISLVQSWDIARQFSFGSPDLAAFVTLAAAIADAEKQENGSFLVLDQPMRDELFRAAGHAVALMLADAQEFPGELAANNTISGAEPCWWYDFFSTAEVVDALIEFVEIFELCEGYYVETSETREELIVRIQRVVLSALSNISVSQNDGMWGSHVDTLRTLAVYAKADSLANRANWDVGFRCDVGVVFKCIRFICDYHQWFDDGSYQHTLYLGVFCSQAFQSVLLHWNGRHQTILSLYDNSLWDKTRADGSSVVISELKLELARASADYKKRVREDLEKLKEKNAQLVQARQRQRSIVSGVLILVFTGLILFYMGIVDLSVNLEGNAEYISIIISIATALFAIILFLISIYSRDN